MTSLAIICALCVVALIVQQVFHARERRETEKARDLERGALLQRIQAPEVAVIEQAKTERKPVPTVEYDDDASFHEAKRAMNGDGN